MPLTYRDLKDRLGDLTEEQLDMNVSVEIDTEIVTVSRVLLTDVADILDVNHPVLFVRT